MATSKVVAVKFVPRPLSKAAIPFMLNEVEVQANLGEPCLNIIYLYEIILTRTHLALVMEYASGAFDSCCCCCCLKLLMRLTEQQRQCLAEWDA